MNLTYKESINNMKKYYIYLIKNQHDVVEYVGQTIKPKERLYCHRAKNGKFNKRTDIQMVIIDEAYSSYDAYTKECKYKEQYGLPLTEKIRNIKSGNAKIISGELNNMRKKMVEKISKPIIAYKDGNFIGEYTSIRSASRELKVNNIPSVLSGKYKQTNGYTFKYKNKDMNNE